MTANLMYEKVEIDGRTYQAFDPAIFLAYTTGNGDRPIYTEEDLDVALKSGLCTMIPDDPDDPVLLVDSRMAQVASASKQSEGTIPYKLDHISDNAYNLTFGARTRTYCTPILMAHIIADVFECSEQPEEIAMALIRSDCRLEMITNHGKDFVIQYKIFRGGNLVTHLTMTEPEGDDLSIMNILKMDGDFAEYLQILTADDTEGWRVKSDNFYLPQFNGRVVPFELTEFSQNGMN